MAKAKARVSSLQDSILQRSSDLQTSWQQAMQQVTGRQPSPLPPLTICMGLGLHAAGLPLLCAPAHCGWRS